MLDSVISSIAYDDFPMQNVTKDDTKNTLHIYLISHFHADIFSLLTDCLADKTSRNNNEMNFWLLCNYIRTPVSRLNFFCFCLQTYFGLKILQNHTNFTWLVGRAQLLLLLTLLWLLLLGMNLMLWSGLSMCWMYCQQFSFCKWQKKRENGFKKSFDLAVGSIVQLDIESIRQFLN